MNSTASLRHMNLRGSLNIIASHKPTFTACCSLRSMAFVIATVLSFLVAAYGQVCPDPPPQTSGTYRFRRSGDSISIPISLADCQPVALDLRWSNGPNNGSLFDVTFWDSSHQPTFTRQISGFMSGTLHFPLESLEPQPWLGSRSRISFPTKVTNQAANPFSSPVSICVL
jgi:hypothetical protein